MSIIGYVKSMIAEKVVSAYSMELEVQEDVCRYIKAASLQPCSLPCLKREEHMSEVQVSRWEVQ